MQEQELEEKIENKEITPEQLPDNSPIQKEAEQVYDDNPHNDEVNNEALDQTVVAEDVIENHPEEVKDIVEDTPLEKETEQVLDTTETKDDEVNNEAIEEAPQEVVEELADKDRFLRGEYGYNSLEDLDKAASDFGYSIDDYDVYQDTDDIGDYFYALKKAVESGDEEAVNDIIENADKPLFQNAEPVSFEEYAQQAQSEQDAIDAQKREQEKIKAEMNLGRGNGGMVIKSDGFLGGRHWYDVSPETLAEYSNQLIEDGEALLGQASDMGKQLSENDAWDSLSRGNVGAVSTRGNGLLKKGKRLQAISGYLQKNSIDPSGLEPRQRKLMMGLPLPGDKWNRKGTQEEYEHNLDVIMNFPSAAPVVVDKTVIKPVEEELGVSVPEEVKQDVVSEPEFFQNIAEQVSDGIDWSKVHIYSPNEEGEGMGWNNGKVDTFDPNAPDYEPSGDTNVDITDDDVDTDVTSDTVDVVDNGLEDQNQYQEGVSLDETVADPEQQKVEAREEDWEKVPGFENIDNVAQLKQEVEQGVEQDEDIPEEEKEETVARRNRILDWYFGQKINMSGTGGSVTTPKTETPKSGLTVGGGIGMGSLFKNMGGGSGSVSSPSVGGGKVSPNQYKPQTLNAKAGGGSKPVVPQSSTPVSIKNGKNSSGIASTSGNYSSGSVPHTSSKLSARSVTTGSSGASKPTTKGVTLKAQKTLGGNKSSGDFNIDKFIDALIKDSHTWENPANSGDKFKPYTVEIGDSGSVLINNTKVEKAVTKDPECVSYIMERLG